MLAGGGAGCDLPGQPTGRDRYVSPRKETSFEALFKQNCVGCHGADGTLGPAPPLNDRLFLALIPDTELERVIREGRPSTLMPAFAADRGGALTAAQVRILAAGMKRQWEPVQPLPFEVPAYLTDATGGDGGGNADNGRTVFARACASCHGDNGQSANSGADSQEPSIGSINQPDFLALISDQALRRLVITGRPDLGMPDFEDAKGRPEGFKPPHRP